MTGPTQPGTSAVERDAPLLRMKQDGTTYRVLQVHYHEEDGGVASAKVIDVEDGTTCWLRLPLSQRWEVLDV